MNQYYERITNNSQVINWQLVKNIKIKLERIEKKNLEKYKMLNEREEMEEKLAALKIKIQTERGKLNIDQAVAYSFKAR